MKKLVLLVPAAILTVGLMASEDATAGNPPPVATVALNPAILRLFLTNVHGTVDMTAARTGQYAGMTCDKLGISAASVATKPCPPGGGFCVPQPKWIHSEMKLANGADANHCTYEIIAPSGSPFSLSVGTQVNLCGGSGITIVNLKPSPSTGQLTIPLNGNKEADLVITEFVKECIN